ncbi:MAG TPA: FtsL-like putative cell division protein [Cytophagaceae bacterium]
MRENTLKSSQGEEKKTVFRLLDKIIKVDKLFEDGIPVKYLPHVLYVTAFIIFYIGNAHYAERVVRQTAKIKAEVDDLRADFTTLKADLMYKSKQSEVAKLVKHLGLEETLTPPHIITIEEE